MLPPAAGSAQGRAAGGNEYENGAYASGQAPRRTPPGTTAPHVMDSRRSKPRRPGWTAQRQLVVTGAALAVLVAALVGHLIGASRPGEAFVTVAALNGADVQGVRVIVDGQQVCDDAPCRVPDLSPGVHLFKVDAPGYLPMEERAFTIDPAQQAVVAINLATGDEALATLEVGALPDGQRVVVDGQDQGVPPIKVTHLAPGEHLVQVVDSSDQQLGERRVELLAGKTEKLGPGLQSLPTGDPSRIELGSRADGATLSVECSGQEPLVLRPPVAIQIKSDRVCSLVSERPGFEPLSQTLTLDDGVVEGMVTVGLGGGMSEPPPNASERNEGETSEARADGVAAREASAGAVESGVMPKKPAPHAKVAQASEPAAGGRSILNVSSVPRVSVLIDGRPAGRTPMRFATTPGRHTVTFVHPQRGRKIVSVKVAPGRSATAAVRFGGRSRPAKQPRPATAAPAAAPTPPSTESPGSGAVPRLGVIQPPKVLAQ